MEKRSTWPSDSHLKKVWIALGSTLLLSLIVPSAFILFQAVALYWGGLLCIGGLRIIIEAPSSPRRSRPAPPARAYPTEPVPTNWEDSWLAKCESPAEAAFLKAAILEFALLPAGERLEGEVVVSLQERISSMRVDFLFGRKLVVEVDGAAYHSSPRQRTRDFKRDSRLKELDYSVLRIPASVVLSTPREAMREVRAELRRHAPA